MKRLFVLAIVLVLLVVTVSSVSADSISMNNVPAVEAGSAVKTDDVVLEEPTSPDVEPMNKATPILF